MKFIIGELYQQIWIHRVNKKFNSSAVFRCTDNNIIEDSIIGILLISSHPEDTVGIEYYFDVKNTKIGKVKITKI